jgi:hypothetical protein
LGLVRDWSLAPFRTALSILVCVSLGLFFYWLDGVAFFCLGNEIEICYSIIIGKHLDFKKRVTIMAAF